MSPTFMRPVSSVGVHLPASRMQGPGKKWEHYELTANGKPLRIPMHVKKGDTVQIISGDDKGKVGEIAKVLIPRAGRVLPTL